MSNTILRRIIHSSFAPAAIGPYSQAVLVDKTLYISGQLGLDAQTGSLVPGGVEAEAKKALDNMGHILEAAGISYKNVVKTTVLLADINDFGKVNEIYRQYFTENFPARAAYQVAALPRAGRVEIEAVAVVGVVEDMAKL
ncbi:2-iminobutanoate/2-iminopropanoate deaminase [Daphnia magna]|uniref:2-iminobutanoate/2-iminopropanoate deaminase n=1 Tax=Daphnia magna TaxID=35525 RepID=UPI001402F2CC|nr:2-iminobutanoate/2-iminopropanoate deaminase [Daphnia magna]